MRTDEVVALTVFFAGVLGVLVLDRLALAVWLGERRARRAGAGPTAPPAPRGLLERCLSPRPVRWALLALTVLGVGSVVWGRLAEPDLVELTTTKIETPLLPAGTRVRLLHLSDLHVEAGAKKRLDRAAALVGALEPRPDYVLLTGDYLNDDRPESGKLLSAFLAAVVRPERTFAVPGNWDGLTGGRKALEAAGAKFLDGSWVSMEEAPAVLAGLSFGTTEFLGPVARAWRGDRFTVVLAHSPDVAEAAAVAGMDLVLCGHTHGGQVRLPLVGALVTLTRVGRKHDAGHFVLPRPGAAPGSPGGTGGVTHLYVNRGLGMEGAAAPRVRFLCRPEVAVLDLVGTGPAAAAPAPAASAPPPIRR